MVTLFFSICILDDSLVYFIDEAYAVDAFDGTETPKYVYSCQAAFISFLNLIFHLDYNGNFHPLCKRCFEYVQIED
jgi:hypothetical protein